eukprot:TRINITY_DN1939_c0_g1_i3.p1 TRINITY_DN1939_c0_g1~~TRINITY_DN1939_c0_g1_i3.p1  ORF type:complete len:159 (-),score=28.73 TRINITY_DN1939_c0_g1_i3:135-611(-)
MEIKSDEEWRQKLSELEYTVLRKNGTEKAFTGEYTDHFDKGVYCCKGCDAPLYIADTKFHSGCGWPAFFDAIEGAVTLKEDNSGRMKRIEVRCTKCDSHLGHLFKGEKFKTPIDQRYCINSVCLNFQKKKDTTPFFLKRNFLLASITILTFLSYKLLF